MSFLAVMLAERFRWRRERRDSWDDRMFDASRQFVHSVGVMVFAARRLAAAHGLMEGPLPAELEDVRESLVQADTEISLAFESLRLLGDEDLAATARRLRRSAWQLCDYA